MIKHRITKLTRAANNSINEVENCGEFEFNAFSERRILIASITIGDSEQILYAPVKLSADTSKYLFNFFGISNKIN